jgi:hypothetical protein
MTLINRYGLIKDVINNGKTNEEAKNFGKCPSS